MASRRRILDVLLVPLGALAVLVALSAPWGFKDVYPNSIEYHLDKTGEGNRGGNAEQARHDLLPLEHGPGRRSAAVEPRGRHRHEAQGPATRALDGHPEPKRTLRERWFGGSRFLWWWAGAGARRPARPGPDVPQPPRRPRRAARAPRGPLPAVVAGGRRRRARHDPVPGVAARASSSPRRTTPGDAAVVVDALRELPDGAWALSDEPGLHLARRQGHRPVLRRPVGAAHRLRRQGDQHHRRNAARGRGEPAAVRGRRLGAGALRPVRDPPPGPRAGSATSRSRTSATGRGLWLRAQCDPTGRKADRAAPAGARAGRTTAAAAPARSPG